MVGDLENKNTVVKIRALENNSPGEEVATLTNSDTLTPGEHNVFTAPSVIVLKANSNYVVTVGEGLGSNQREGYAVTKNDADTGQSGWLIWDIGWWRNGDNNSWSRPVIESLKMALRGTLVANPVVSVVSITSGPGEDKTYTVGNVIEATVTFTEPVTVAGALQLRLRVGDTARIADFSSASDGDVKFVYTVEVGDVDDDGVAIPANAVELNGGTITGEFGGDAILTQDRAPADPGHLVSSPGGI